MSKQDMDQFLGDLQKQIKEESLEVMNRVLNDAIRKKIIGVRQSDPVLIKRIDSPHVELHHSVVLDYLGAERIDELEKGLDYLKNMVGDLHNALSDFYEKSRPNTWLKREEDGKE